MTRKEAIEFLKNMIDREAVGFVAPQGDGDVAIWQYHVEALQMAIKALEQPEVIRCKDCKYNSNPPEYGNAVCDTFYGMTDQMGFCHRAERRKDGNT